MIFCSCNNTGKHPYAIKDFREKLQPYLTKMVARGIVMSSDSTLQHMATDDELVYLGTSEHPILRAAAFREMLSRKSFNHFDILMAHLDDTALVATDGGEFGIWYRTVSDDILQEAGWNTKDEKDKTVEQVLTRHNYLRSAYRVLLQIEPQEKYYPFIKEMATRSRRLAPYDGYELDFVDIEYALYGLAKFRKKTDVEFIKEKLSEHIWRLSDVSFRLMKEYPDTAYLDILQTYHRRNFYNFSGDDRDGFTGNDHNHASSKAFIEALVSQQSNESAQLLDTILHRLPSITCVPNKDYIEDEVVMQIWENPTAVYTKLKDRVRGRAEQILKGRIVFPNDRYNKPIDTTKENIRWYH